MADIESELKSFFGKSKLPILFAGAGVSAKAGLPAWGGYLTRLGALASEYDEYTKYQMDLAIKEGALGDAAMYYMLCRKIPEATKLKGLAEPLIQFNHEELSSLVQLPFQSVVTTNFDRALFAAYAKYTGAAVKEVNIDDPTLESASFLDELYIARIHGRVEVPISMRLTSAALSELEKNNIYQRYLEHVFTRRQVLFLGFSFLDPAIESVLRAVRLATKSMHGQEHLALVPKGAPAEFISQLEAHSIRRFEYAAEDYHRALWEGIQLYVSNSKLNPKVMADVREQPFRVARKYLATAYARARIGNQREPLALAIAEGIVSGIIQNSGDAGVQEDKLILQLREDLSLDEDAARTLVLQSIMSLTRSGVCKIDSTNSVVSYRSVLNGISPYDSAIARLTEGVIGRYVIIERGSDSAQVRTFLSELFGRLLLRRGWDLGAAYASRRMPENINIFDVVNSMKTSAFRDAEIDGMVRAVESMLMRPDDDEAELLAELGRTAFGLELLLEAPHDSLFLKNTLPQRIYFDANVIMPAITPGHAYYKLFNETISALKEAAGTAVLDVSLRIYDGFLNEIVSHKRLARDAMSANNGEGAAWEERTVGLYGSDNVNVFVGAYFNYRESHKDISFDQFLHVAAPYDTEADLRKHLEKLGFQVVREREAVLKGMPEILHALEKYYSNRLESNSKSAVVIRHDALQLAIINAEVQNNIRSMFVTADKGIRLALEHDDSGVSNSMMTHLGLAQLVELLVGRLPSSRGLASLLWMSSVSDDTARIRNYLISLALKEHDAALAMAMGTVVNEIAENAAMEISRKKLKLEPEQTRDRAELNRVLGGYESQFFQKLNAEVDKLRDRQG